MINLLINLLILLTRKEFKDMAAIYVALIIKGKRTFSSVPEKVKPQVREMLRDLELEELIEE